MDYYKRLSSDQLKERIARGAGPAMIDLRSKEEFERGHIAGSQSLPIEKLDPAMFIDSQKKEPFILICRSGALAYKAADILLQSGVSDCYILAGGLLAWRVLGFPLAQSDAAGQ